MELYDQLDLLDKELYELEDETHALLYDYVIQRKAELVSACDLQVSNSTTVKRGLLGMASTPASSANYLLNMLQLYQYMIQLQHE